MWWTIFTDQLPETNCLLKQIRIDNSTFNVLLSASGLPMKNTVLATSHDSFALKYTFALSKTHTNKIHDRLANANNKFQTCNKIPIKTWQHEANDIDGQHPISNCSSNCALMTSAVKLKILNLVLNFEMCLTNSIHENSVTASEIVLTCNLWCRNDR